MTRRSFLTSSTVLATAAVAGCASGDSAAARNRARVGTQLYGWGQYYNRAGKKLEEHWEELLGQIREAGFDYAEGWLDVADPENHHRFAERLRQAGLQPVSLYTGGAFHVPGAAMVTAERIAAAARNARAAGFTGLVCNPDPLAREKTDEELRTQAAALTQLGAELERMGVAFGLHQHTPEFRSQGREFHSNFRLTPPRTVGFCYDVHWVYRGGVMPADALRDYGNRIVSWHLRQSRQQIWWEDLAPGDIDYAAIAQWAHRHGKAHHLTVELALEQGTAVTRSGLENHRRSRAYVREVFGV